MKRQLRISLFIAIVGATLVGAVNGNTGAGPVLSPAHDQISDTLDAGKFIKVDKFYLEIFPPSSGVQFYQNGIVFLSNTKEEAGMPEIHTSFGIVEAYFAEFNDTTIGNHTIFSPSYPWEVPTEGMTFNKDYSVMYYSKWPGKKESEKIYQAKYQVAKNGKREWLSDNIPLGFCTDKSVYTHPALSPDGEKIVFSSDRSESSGGLDLFISYKEGDGWSSPVNLGNKINTTGNELYPFLDQENNLFYSSDGIKGFGGYDIYFCRYNGNGWDKPVNLTQEINSANDDIAFTMSRLDGKSAFFTTRLKTLNRTTQLFKITFRDQYAVTSVTNLPGVFKYIALAELSPAETVVTAANKQKEVKQEEKETAQTPEKQVAETKKPPVKPAEKPIAKTVPVQTKPAAGQTSTSKDAVVYRVQFSSNMKPKGSYEITAGGKKYKTFEYLFNGAYRSCAGAFSTSSSAASLEKLMKQEGYPDAFVVAFRNNERFTGNIQEQPGQKLSSEAAQTQKVTAIKQEPPKPTIQEPSAVSDAVVYRVQFSASMKPKGSYEVTTGGKTYKTFEYMSNGAYRSCVGEFSTSGSAASLQKLMKQEGYPDAFVVAFKNGVRSTDPALF
jgi:hypothetical protein